MQDKVLQAVDAGFSMMESGVNNVMGCFGWIGMAKDYYLNDSTFPIGAIFGSNKAPQYKNFYEMQYNGQLSHILPGMDDFLMMLKNGVAIKYNDDAESTVLATWCMLFEDIYGISRINPYTIENLQWYHRIVSSPSLTGEEGRALLEIKNRLSEPKAISLYIQFCHDLQVMLIPKIGDDCAIRGQGTMCLYLNPTLSYIDCKAQYNVQAKKFDDLLIKKRAVQKIQYFHDASEFPFLSSIESSKQLAVKALEERHGSVSKDFLTAGEALQIAWLQADSSEKALHLAGMILIAKTVLYIRNLKNGVFSKEPLSKSMLDAMVESVKKYGEFKNDLLSLSFMPKYAKAMMRWKLYTSQFEHGSERSLAFTGASPSTFYAPSNDLINNVLGSSYTPFNRNMMEIYNDALLLERGSD